MSDNLRSCGFSLLAALLACLSAASLCLGWGGQGHRVQVEQVQRLVDKPVGELMRQGEAVDFAFYPDTFSSFDEELVSVSGFLPGQRKFIRNLRGPRQ